MPDLGDQDKFGSDPDRIKDYIWGQILADGKNWVRSRAWWNDVAQALDELAGEAHMIADGTTSDPISSEDADWALTHNEPDEITPEDLPHA